MSTSLSFRRLAPSELVAVHALEIDGFPTDEAASLSSLQQRLSLAPQLFIGAFVSPSLAVMEQEELPADSSSSGGREELIGYVCSTLTPSSTLTHASMKTHVPESAYVAIHSVCVAAAHRRQAVAGRMLEHYLMELRGMQGVKGARLITHDELVPLYTSAGFLLIGESDVVHGARKWHEMAIDFEEMREKAVPAVEVRSPGVLFDSFENGMRQLVDGEGLNSVDLYCPRGECRCLLLRKGAANWVTNGVGRSSFELPPLPHLIASPTTSSSSQGYWSVASPLSFENIGFSRNALPPSTVGGITPSSSNTSVAANGTMKYLICADCDHGPLGWHDTEGRDLGLEVEVENELNTGIQSAGSDGVVGEVRRGREFLLDVERVRYRV